MSASFKIQTQTQKSNKIFDDDLNFSSSVGTSNEGSILTPTDISLSRRVSNGEIQSPGQSQSLSQSQSQSPGFYN